MSDTTTRPASMTNPPGLQQTVCRNYVNFIVGDVVRSRLRSEHLMGRVIAVNGDLLTMRIIGGVFGGEAHLLGTEATFDADYFYILRGGDETAAEASSRHLHHRELTR